MTKKEALKWIRTVKLDEWGSFSSKDFNILKGLENKYGKDFSDAMAMDVQRFNIYGVKEK